MATAGRLSLRIAHEVRNPISAIELNAEMLEDIVRERNKVVIGSGAGTALLTGEKCSPNTVHWTYDTWAMGHGLARTVMRQGGRTWFFASDASLAAFLADPDKYTVPDYTMFMPKMMGEPAAPEAATPGGG